RAYRPCQTRSTEGDNSSGNIPGRVILHRGGATHNWKSVRERGLEGATGRDQGGGWVARVTGWTTPGSDGIAILPTTARQPGRWHAVSALSGTRSPSQLRRTASGVPPIRSASRAAVRASTLLGGFAPRVSP